MSAATALSLVASAIFLTRLIPQPARLWRSRVTAGVSPVAAANAVTSASAWLAYGLVHELPVVWIVSVIALVPGVWTVVLLHREFGRRELLASGAVAAVFASSALVGALGIALSLGVLATAGPQVWRALRETDLRGIAPATWFVAIADALTWGGYGVLISDRALEGYGAVLLTSAVVVLGRIAWTRARRADAAAPAAALRVAGG
jgi:uncharacterized protein with PQ loop repeat